MSNKFLNLLAIFILLFCFHSCVYAATETGGEVKAKYVFENGNIFYEKTLNQNNEINVVLDNRVITLKSNNKMDNGTNIVFIPVKSDALKWLIGTATDDSKKVYYIDFYKNNKKVSLNGNVSIKIKSCEFCEVETVYYYDTNKNIINNINNLGINMDLNINSSGYLLFDNHNIKTVIFDVSENGDFVFNNTSYKNNGKVYSDISNPEVAIRPNNGYVIDKVILNGEDVSNSVVGNFLKLNLNTTNNLKITFKKDLNVDSNGKFIIKGKVYYDYQPIKNAKISINNNSLATYTDEYGNFKIENLKFGEYSISVEDNNKIIGYSLFRMVNNGANDSVVINDNITEMTFSNRTNIIHMNLNIESNLKIDFSNFYSIIKGDVNCDGLVNVTDLVQLRMYLSKMKELSSRGLEAANIKEDNKIDITDLIKLRRYLAGLEKW